MSQKDRPWEENRVRDGRNRFRMWIRGLASDRGPKAAWHLTCFISSSVSFPCHSPPATDATTTHSGRNDNAQQREELCRTRGLDTGAACENRLESSRFASDLSVSLMQRRPQIHYKPIICAGPGPGLGTHSWTAVLNPQRGVNRKFENRIHTWVTLEGFGWINELSGSLSTCWGAQSFTS